MRRKKVKVEKHNTRIAIFFVSFVCAIILISVILKTIQQVRQSKFDGSNRFTISVSNDKNLEVVSFSPNKHSISILRIDGEVKNLNIGQFLKIPIDGFVDGYSIRTNKDTADLMSNIFFNYNNIKTNLTIIDILRLFLSSRITLTNNISSNSISLSSDDRMFDKIVEKLFKDEAIEKENQTVEIVNATYITGLGNRLGRLVTNMGGNVVVVSTQNNPQKNSSILYNGKKSYTVDKLSKVLGFGIIETNKQTIADITIIVGEDNKDPSSF